MAPVMPFTADEVWALIPGRPTESVHTRASRSRQRRRPLGPDWPALLEARAVVTKALEEARAAKQIAGSLEARVDLTAPGGGAGPAAPARGAEHGVPRQPRQPVHREQGRRSPRAKGRWRSRLPAPRARRCERCWTYSENVGRPGRPLRRVRALRGGARRRRHGERERHDVSATRRPRLLRLDRRGLIVALDQVAKALVDRYMDLHESRADRRRPRPPHLRPQPRRGVRDPLRRRPALPVAAVLGHQHRRPRRHRRLRVEAARGQPAAPDSRWP